MMTRKNPHFHVLVTALVIISFAMPLVYQSPEVAAGGPDEFRQIDLYLKHDSNTDYFMNTIQENPGDDTGVTEVTWNYGWWVTDHVEDEELLSDLTIQGTFANGAEVFIEVRVENQALTSDVDVTMELLDNGEVIAETTETLNDFISGNNENSVWRLPFNENADESDRHTFSLGNTISVRMTATGNVNVGYRAGDAHMEFETDQIHDDEFKVKDVNDNDMYGQEFVPKYPAESGLGIVHIEGYFLDTITHRDVDTIELIIEGPDKTFTPDAFAAQSQLEPLGVVFHFNWSYSDELDSEDDAGTYYVTIIINDNSGNNITFEEELRFVMSKYGVYMALEDGEPDTQFEGPGHSVLYHMVIHNAGLVDGDTIEITLNTNLGDWTAVVDPDSLILDSPDFETIELNVTIPEDEEVFSSLEVKVTATSLLSTEDDEYGDASDNIRTTTTVKPTAKVAVFFREQDSDDDASEFEDIHSKSGNAEKGVDREFNFRVKNDSPNPDEITLYITGIPNDWSATIIDPETDEDVNNVTLDGSDEVLLHVKIRPATAQGASNEANLKITGVSGNNDSVEDTAYLNVTRTLGVVVSVDEFWEEKLLALRPDIQNTIDFIIENTGNEDRTFNIDIDMGSLSPDEWRVEIASSTSITVAQGTSEIFSVDITPEANAVNSEDGYEFTINAEDENDDSVKYDFTVTMNVETQYKLEIEITVREHTIEEAGDSVNYIIRVKNAGNSQVTITLEVTKDKNDWDAQLNIAAATFEAGSAEKEFILTVTAPDPVDNKETCTVTVTASIIDHPETAQSQTTKTKVKKDDVTSIMDTIEEYSWMLLLLMVVIIIAVVLYYNSQQYDEEDEYEDYEDYEDDDWE